VERGTFPDLGEGAHIADKAHGAEIQRLESAIENGELLFHYQPLVSLVTGRLVGAEALIRWQLPDGRIAMPDSFIPIAEATGLIREITLNMLPRLLSDWMIIDSVDPDFLLSFNVSAKDLQTPRLVDAVQSAIGQRNLDPQRLGLEVTETAFLESDDVVRRHLNAIVEFGVSLVMDDYGTGFSSIDSLSRWPFDCIKLDRTLIGRMASSEKTVRIVNASIRMAHDLNLHVVAEGVEDRECYEFLMQSGCSRVQGNWIAPALPLRKLLGFLEGKHRWSALPMGLLHLAQLDHIQWRRELLRAVVQSACFGDNPHQHNLTEIPEMDHRECGLGKWFFGPGQEFADSDEFRKLDDVHRKLHAVGTALVDASRSGASLERLTRLMQELSKTSVEVIWLLQEIENKFSLAPHPTESRRFC